MEDVKNLLLFTKKGIIVRVAVDKIVFDEQNSYSIAMPAGNDEVVFAMKDEW